MAPVDSPASRCMRPAPRPTRNLLRRATSFLLLLLICFSWLTLVRYTRLQPVATTQRRVVLPHGLVLTSSFRHPRTGGDDASEGDVRRGSGAATAADRALWDDAKVFPPRTQAQGSPSRETPAPGWRATDTPALLVIACNRVHYLNETLLALAQTVRGVDSLHVYISVDGHDGAVTALADEAVSTLFAPPRSKGAQRWTHDPPTRDGHATPGRRAAPHVALAVHYRWALDRVFGGAAQAMANHSHVIIVEDDLLLSPDALQMFAASAPLLDAGVDNTLWCVSAWNDNGARDLVSGDHFHGLRRTSFFPGLGWMMTAATWHATVAPAWPRPWAGDWDWHLRLAPQLGGSRECVHPVVPRAYTIGRFGANMRAQLYDRHLVAHAWAAERCCEEGPPPRGWTADDFAAMHETRWIRDTLQPAVAHAVPLDWRRLKTLGRAALASEWRAAQVKPDERRARLLLTYASQAEYAKLSSAFGLWPQPRGHSRGVLLLEDATFQGSYALVDARQPAPGLPARLRVLPPAGLARRAASRPGLSCTEVCAAQNQTCGGEGAFDWVNTCTVLSEHMTCGAGCTLKHGSHLPAYVAAGDAVMGGGTCFVTHAVPRCGAKAPTFWRLCPCVPRRLRVTALY